jgi:hypothetical protein
MKFGEMDRIKVSRYLGEKRSGIELVSIEDGIATIRLLGNHCVFASVKYTVEEMMEIFQVVETVLQDNNF